jgi:hypothetical protein
MILGSMNHFLVSMLGALNIILAVTIVATSAVAGWNKQADIVGLLAGAVVGIGVAAFVCGFLAILISIEQSLKRIADAPEGLRTRALGATDA